MAGIDQVATGWPAAANSVVIIVRMSSFSEGSSTTSLLLATGCLSRPSDEMS